MRTCTRWILWVLCVLVSSAFEGQTSQNFNSAIIDSKISLITPRRLLLQTSDHSCADQGGVAWHTCLLMGCGVNVESDLYISVTESSCRFDQTRHMWICGPIAVDSMTYEALKTGECRQGCRPEKLLCESIPRFETKANFPIVSSVCPNGDVTTEFNCACTIVSRTAMLKYAENNDGNRGGCRSVCSAEDRDLSNCVVQPAGSRRIRDPRNCGTVFCLYQNCASQISRVAEDIVKRSTCSFSQESRMWNCGGILEIDDPGYKWAKNGNCVDACSIRFRSDSCLFQARYGAHPDSSMIEDIEEESEKGNNKPRKFGNKKRRKKPPKTTNKDKGEDKKKRKKKSSALLKKKRKLRDRDRQKKEKTPKVEKPDDDDDDIPLDGGRYFLEDDYVEDEYYSDASEDDEEEPPLPPPEPSASIHETDPETTDPFVEVADTDRDYPDPVVAIIQPPKMPPAVNETDAPTEASLPSEGETTVGVSTTRVEYDEKEPKFLALPVGEFQSYASPWMPCRQDCSDSQFRDNARERFVVCRSKANGMPVARQACPRIDKTSSIEACPNGSLCRGTFVYEYTDWSSCELDDLGQCYRHREVDCYERLEDGSLFPTSETYCAKGVRRLPCDPRQCRQAIYLASDWSPCDCARSIQTRNLTCASIVDENQRINETICEEMNTARPATTRNCSCDVVDSPGRRLLQTENSCADRNCSGHGVCRLGRCDCTPPYIGDDCASFSNVTIRDEQSCEGNFTIDGVCCQSGVYDRNYTCCENGATLDKEGNCCVGRVDACGICNGDALFVDAYSQCCATTLDANGFCCRSGNVDECGVCDGFGRSCDLRLQLAIANNDTADQISDGCVENLISRTLSLAEGVSERRATYAIGDGTLTVYVPGSLIAFDRSIDAIQSTLQTHLDDPTGGAVSCHSHRFELRSVDRRPVGGNGFCEIGETIFVSTPIFSGVFAPDVGRSGIDDCSFVIATCPSPADAPGLPCSGTGVCSFAGMATCTCFVGYEGDACDMCRDGYALRNGRCLPVGRRPVDTSETAELSNATDTSNITDSSSPHGMVNQIEETTPKPSENGGRQLTPLISMIVVVVAVFILLAFALYVGWPAQHDQAPSNSMDGHYPSSDHSRGSSFGADSHDITASASNRTTSSGTPIAVKLEPEEIGATPPKRVSETLDGSNFHGNRMHRPFLAAAHNLSYPFQAVTRSTVDISGERRQMRRMPSPEENSQLFPIEEGSSMTFETDSPFARGQTQLSMQSSSKSLESDGTSLASFEQWMGSSSLETSPKSLVQSPTESSGRGGLTPVEQSRYRSDSAATSMEQSTARSEEERGMRQRDDASMSSFEFDERRRNDVSDTLGSPSTPLDASGIAQSFVERWGRHFFERGELSSLERRSNSSDERSGSYSTGSPSRRHASF